MKKIVTLSLLSLSVCAAFGQATTPAVSTPLYYCQAASAAPLTATAGSSSDTLYWYTAATGGSGSRTAPVPSTATAGTVKYYVSAKPASGAESPRAEIAVYTSPAIPPFQLRTTDSLLCIGESTKLFSGLAASGTLSTPLIDDNKSRGIMFDIVAKRGLMITGFEVHTEIVSGEPFRIYYKTGSSSGYESSAAAWTLLGSVALSGSTGVTSIPLPVNVTIPAGQTAAFYLTNTGTANVRYHEGTGAGTVFKEDDNLQILEGVGKAFPFGSTSANRRFEGIVKYEKLSATWSTGALTDTVTAMPALTTKYWATISNTAGCMGTDTIPVQVAPLAAAPVANSPVVYCQYAASAPLSATKGNASDTLLWYTSATGGTGSKTAPSPATAAAGTFYYYVSAKTSSGCEGARDTVEVRVNPAAAAPVAASPVTYCRYAAATALTATAGSASDTLLWYTMATGGTGSKTAPVPSTASAGTTYRYVSAKSSLGCEGMRDTIEVRVQAAAGTPTVSTPVRYCRGAAAVPLTAGKGTASDTLYWYTSASGGSSSLIAPTPSTAATGSTFYYVSGKNTMGCEGLRASIEVVVSTAARPSAPSPLTYCQNAVAVPLTATAGSASDTLFWYTSATGGTGTKTAPTPVTTAAGTFYYYVSGKTSLACEGDRDTVAVIVNPAAGTPVAPSPVTYCQNAMAVPLTATPDIDIDTLLWFTGATGGTGSKTAPTPSTAAAGSVFYYVGAKTEAGCQGGRDTIEVITYPAAASPSAPSPVNYCQGATASALTATKGSATDTLLWYTSATGGTGSKTAPTPSTAATGTTFYYVSGKTNKGCEGARDTIEVNVYPPAAMPTAPSPVTYCQSATAAPLTATAGSTTDTLLWYTVATGGTGSKTAPTPSTAAAGSKFYYVSAKTLMGCEGKRDTIEVIVKAAATPVVSSPVNYCQGAAAVPLTATKGSTTDTLYWYTSATAVTGSKTAPTPSTAAAGTSSYYVSVRTTANCESPRAKIDVQVNAPASQPVAASPLNLCQGATAAALTATKGSSTDTLFWYTSPTGGTGSKTAPTPSTASTGTSSYYVSAKSNKGCEGTRDTIDVIVNPVPAVPTVSTPVVYCQNATASALTAGRGSASDTLFWYTAATGGTGSKTAPTPSTASTGTSSRYVSAKNTFGCESNRAKIDITINPKGATPGVTSPVHYCRGDAPMPLTATAGSSSDTLYWYTAASGGTGTKAAPTPSTATAGTTKYYVSARTSLGCEGDRATIEVQVHPPADTPGVSTPLVYCRNDKAFALSASMVLSSDTLLWYTSATGGTPSRTAPIPSTATDGTTYYYVSAKSSFGCEGGRDTIAVVVNPLPVVSVSSLSPTGTIRCRNIDSIVLKATAPTALSYQWYYEVTPQPGATRDTVHARASGYWYAVVTDAKGCRGKDSLWVQRDTLEEPVLTPPDNKICIGGSVLLTCSPGYVVNRFRWYRNGILLPAIPVTRSITSVSDTGSYTVSMTNAAGCTYKTNTARVEYYPPTPKPKLVYTPPVLSVSGGSYRAYQWYQDMKWLFGATGSTYTVTDEGDYYVEVTDVNGCTSKSDTLYIQPPTSLGPQYATLQLKLYPNPTSSVVRIDAPIKVNVMVTDLSGKPVLPVQEAQTVDLKDLADGSYFFRITDEHGQLLGTEKIQKISR